MPKWEYCALSDVPSNPYGLFRVVPKLRHFTGEGYTEQPLEGGAKADCLARAIARLGEEGWELTGVVAMDDRSHLLYFKRLKG